jgi:urocanate hydratase
VAVTVNAVELLEALVARGATPDVVTDLTAAHDLRHGYVPVGLSAEQARALRADDPAELEHRGRATLARHARALLALRERGAVVFDGGNNLRPQAVAAGVPEAEVLDVFSSRYLRPLFAQGIGPFRWICTSGDDADGALVDELAAAAAPRAARWLALAREHVPREGLPARIAWLGHGERSRLAVAVNAAVADGRLRGPVAFTRDHMDGAAMAHPQILTEGMPDGSDAIADWPLLVGLLAASAGADLVALHQGGGGYAGFSQSAGSTVVADGTPEAAERLRAVLDAETALGVLRHADAGVPEGRAAAHHHDLGVPRR